MPNPASLNNLSFAYLVNNDLYIQVGETSATAIWENIGQLNVATYVTVNGQYQNIWNADTKVDKVTTSGLYRLYGIGSNGETALYEIASTDGSTKTEKRIPMYRWKQNAGLEDTNLCLTTGTPINNYQCATKKYVDDNSKWWKHTVSIEDMDTGAFPIPGLIFYSKSSTQITDSSQIPVGMFGGNPSYNMLYFNDGEIIKKIQFIENSNPDITYVMPENIFSPYVYDDVEEATIIN